VPTTTQDSAHRIALDDGGGCELDRYTLLKVVELRPVMDEALRSRATEIGIRVLGFKSHVRVRSPRSQRRAPLHSGRGPSGPIGPARGRLAVASEELGCGRVRAGTAFRRPRGAEKARKAHGSV
jgi:hypothetical protein